MDRFLIKKREEQRNGEYFYLYFKLCTYLVYVNVWKY